MSRRRTVVLILAGALGLSVAAATLPRATGAIAGGEAAARACPAGSARADDPLSRSGVDPVCSPLGAPESALDSAANAGQLEARSNGPFEHAAPGAYEAALHQAAALPYAGSSLGGGSAWIPYGRAPLCSAPSTGGGVCPAASAENGQYGRTGQEGHVQNSSRVSSLAYDPSNTTHWWASPVTGGVFETTDSGAHWHSVGDSLPTQAVGAIAYDAPLHRLIVGTGDNSYGGDGIAGHGVYYSADDGAGWVAATGIPDLALSFRVVVAPDAAAGAAGVSPGRLVYAALSMGLFRSTDGGGSFANVNLPTTPAGYSPNCAGNTSNSLCFFANDVTDVVVKAATDANGKAGAVIAAVGWRAGQKHDVNPDGTDLTACSMNGAATVCLQAPQNGIYTSADGTPGTFTWESHGTNPNGGTGFAPDQVVGRTALGVAHGTGQNGDAVFALVEDAQKFNGCPEVLDGVPTPVCNSTATAEGLATVLDGLYASYDFGHTWTKVMDWAQLQKPGTGSALFGQTGYSPGVQGWYNLWVDVDPTAKDGNGEPTRVVLGLEEIWENNLALPSGGAPGSVLTTPSTAYPGGSAATDPWITIARYWNACTDLNTGVPCNPNANTNIPPGGTTPHPDQHADMFVPDATGGGVTLVAGNDGGVYAQHIAAGADFNNTGWGDGLGVGLSALQPYDVSISKDGTVVSGLQDNGEMKISPNGDESDIYDGDGFYTTIDPNNSKNILEEYTYGAVALTNDGGTTWNSWAPADNTQTNYCGSSTALFATPIEQDPTQGGHVLLGCSQIQEAAVSSTFPDGVYSPPSCVDPTCSLVNLPWNTVFNLGTAPSGATFIPSALGTRGNADYVGACGYCDVVTGKVPFQNAIATNMGGSQPALAGTTQGWHFAAMSCAACGTANGKLPNRYITSIQVDPSDPNTVYVTLGGYGRRWIPPGAVGDPTGNVGTGHVFMSKDHGDHFVDISQNLPDIGANFVLPLQNELLVATDLGVFASNKPDAPVSWSQLGTGLPHAPAFVLRQNPGDPNQIFVATYGRSDWVYDLSSPTANTPEVPAVLLLPAAAGVAAAAVSGVRRRRSGPGARPAGCNEDGDDVRNAAIRLRRRR